MTFKFPNAQDSRNIADLKAIHDEVCPIQGAILDARCDGLRVVTVCDTPMTNSTDHFDAWKDPLDPCDFDQQELLDLQQAVIDCFIQLGYSIKRITDTNTGNTFCWEIRW